MGLRASIADELLAAFADDPDALGRLRELVAERIVEPTAVPVYTVATLASSLRVTERVVRNAIARGELAAVKRGARWYIAREAVEDWTNAPQHRRTATRSARHRHPLATTFAEIDDHAVRRA